MTKLIKWYKRAKFWQTVYAFIIPLTAGGEFAVYFAGGHPVLYWIIGMAGLAATFVKFISKDENNNNIIDIAE